MTVVTVVTIFFLETTRFDVTLVLEGDIEVMQSITVWLEVSKPGRVAVSY